MPRGVAQVETDGEGRLWGVPGNPHQCQLESDLPSTRQLGHIGDVTLRYDEVAVIDGRVAGARQVGILTVEEHVHLAVAGAERAVFGHRGLVNVHSTSMNINTGDPHPSNYNTIMRKIQYLPRRQAVDVHRITSRLSFARYEKEPYN